MSQNQGRIRRFAARAALLAGIAVCAAFAVRGGRGADASATIAHESSTLPFRGVLTFATPGNGDPFAPTMVQDYDLASGELTVRFDGLDPTRTRTGETAYVTRLAPGWAADHGVVVADPRGVPGAPLHVCKEYNWSNNAICGVPKLAPNGRLVAFVTRGGSGTLCKNNYDMFWGDFVVVTDRQGTEVARFEGYTLPEWLPNGRLLMMGTQCRSAGVWLADPALRSATRIDNQQVSTPAGLSAVSPDGGTLAFVWNRQLWSMTLTGNPELAQLTHLPKSVSAATWSPDGKAIALLMFDVSMPVKSLALLRPGDERSIVFLPLNVYPYGPISWR